MTTTQLTVYSKPKCVQCTATYRALDAAGVTYVIVDITENPSAAEFVTDELSYKQAPVVVNNYDSEDHWSGFRPDMIARIATLSTQ